MSTSVSSLTRYFGVVQADKKERRINQAGYACLALGIIAALGAIFLADADNRSTMRATSVPQGFTEGVLALIFGGILLAPCTITQCIHFEKKAYRGDPAAQFKLGLMLLEGKGGYIKDEKVAVEWLRKAAAQGHAVAQNRLGYCLQKGIGVERDEAGAVAQYRLAAAQGYVIAQNNLGYCLQEGIGVACDRAGAVAQYRLAAAQGYAPAQSNLGVLMQYGIGTLRDEAGAVRQYRRAADQGNAIAQFALGICFYMGIGTEVNLEEALLWFQRAGEKNAILDGSHRSAVRLSEQGVFSQIHFRMWKAAKRKLPQAEMWMSIHSIKGFEGAIPTSNTPHMEMRFTLFPHRIQAEHEGHHEKAIRGLLERFGLLELMNVSISTDGVEADGKLIELDPCDIRVLEAFFILGLLPPEGVHVTLDRGDPKEQQTGIRGELEPLPPEVVEPIIGQLDVASKMNFSLTSSEHYQQVRNRHVWRDFKLMENIPPQRLHLLLGQYGREIQMLDLSEMLGSVDAADREKIFTMIPLYCPNLRELYLDEEHEETILEEAGKNLSLMGSLNCP